MESIKNPEREAAAPQLQSSAPQSLNAGHRCDLCDFVAKSDRGRTLHKKSNTCKRNQERLHRRFVPSGNLTEEPLPPKLARLRKPQRLCRVSPKHLVTRQRNPYIKWWIDVERKPQRRLGILY